MALIWILIQRKNDICDTIGNLDTEWLFDNKNY